MDSSFNNAFIKPIAKASTPGLIISSLSPQLGPSLIGLDVVDKVLQQQADLMSKLGLAKIASAINSATDRTTVSTMAPNPVILQGIQDPIVATVLSVLLLSRAYGMDFFDRLLTVRTYLVLCLKESSFNPVSHSKTSSASGLLQLITSTRANSVRYAQVLLQDSRMLQFLFNLTPLSSDAKAEVLSNLGYMALLVKHVRKQWAWNEEKGWMPTPIIAFSPLTNEFISAHQPLLRDYSTGFQAIASMYHLEGFNKLTHSSTKFQYPRRPVADALEHYKLGRVPMLTEILRQAIAPSGVIPEAGDPGHDEYGSGTVHLNEFIKSRLNFPFHPFALGNGVISSYFSIKPRHLKTSDGEIDRPHLGTDLKAIVGQPVFAVTDGTVLTVRDTGSKGYGRSIVYRSPVGKYFIYGHLTTPLVDPMSEVKQGDIIGLAGATGAVTGPHLHFEVRNDISTKGVNPTSVGIDPKLAVNKKGT
jgi:murein DD-endopeptidase MepM/ murein hydrolase activator NlpD